MTRRIISWAALGVLLATMGAPAATAGGYCHAGGTTQKKTTTVDMKGDCFYPTVTQIDVGDKVTWRNFDGENHIVLGVGGSWGTPEVSPKGSTTVRFDNPGVYPYWCHIHLGMVGAVVVGDGQAAAGTAAGTGPVATLLSSEEPDSTAAGGASEATAPASASSDDTGVDAAVVVAVGAIAGLAGFGVARLVQAYVASRKARPGVESGS